MDRPQQPNQAGGLGKRRPGKQRCRRWIVFLLGCIALTVGCSPITMFNFLLVPWVDNKVPPKCKLAPTEKDKEVSVVLLCDFASLETRPELLPVERELCDRLAQHLRKRFQENKEKISFLPHARVKSYLNQHRDSGLLSAQEIGQHFKADYVINLEIEHLHLYERGSWNRLFRGNTEIAVKVFNVTQPRDEALIFEEIYHCEYPASNPIDANDTSVAQFRALFVNRLARDLARWFAAFPIDEKVDMD